MITAVRLVDGDRTLLIHPRIDVLPQALNVGFPAVREVAEARVDDDGETDNTLLFGARAVSLEVALTDDVAEVGALLDEIKLFLHPRTRPYLHVVDDGWGQERRMRLRVDQFSEPYAGYVASQVREVLFQWKGPDGVWEAADLAEETVNADVPTIVGRTYPQTYPKSYTATLATGAAQITNVGGVPSHFVARLYGPCSGPRLINETTDERIAFTASLTLGAGEYVEIDTRERTAYLLSVATQSRLSYVDFALTSWWRIEPGEQQVRYAPTEVTAGSAAVIEYRPNWL